jgi:hypothetical protein
MDRRLEKELLAVGHAPEQCAWFRPFNSATADMIIFLLEGAAAMTALSPVTGEAIAGINEFLIPNDDLDRKDLTPRVAVGVNAQVVEVWSGDQERALGKQLAAYLRDEFRGHFHHYPERVDLTLDDAENGRMVLTGSWTHLNDECLHTARAAVALASGPAH